MLDLNLVEISYWRRAFRGAVSIVLWSILWVLIGLAFMGLGLAFFSKNATFTSVASVIGYAIAGFGVYAALLKVLSEITAEEVERRIKPQYY